MQLLGTADLAPKQEVRLAERNQAGATSLDEVAVFPNDTQNIEARSAVFYQGDPAEALYEVIQGVVKMYKLTPDGRRQIIGFAFAGEILGSIVGEAHTCTAETITPSRLRRLPQGRLDRALQERPGLSRKLLDLLSSALNLAQEQMLLLGRKTASEKIASFLLAQSEKREQRGEDPSVLFLPMTRADIADYLGLTTETVSRTISGLRRQGVIDLDQANRIRVHDIDSLASLAEGDEEPL